MIHSQPLKNNPSLYVFLPIFYMVWSDAVLTPSELATIRNLIDRQDWLNDGEKGFLLEQVNPAIPPSPDELKGWFAEIQKVVGAKSPNKKESLVDIGIKLVELHAPGATDAISRSRSSLSQMEDTLGLISNEAVFSFYPGAQTTLTEQHNTKQTFDAEALAKLLDGAQADTIRKVKTLLSDKEFRYIDTGNLEEYREKVLKWCRHLADQGFGSMAYPKEYGGQGDMDRYFAIMETLSYHDLSLVIKFGVQFGLFGMSVYFLGTEKHHKKYLKSIGTLELPGCFAMTETGHGSNVRGVETTATYDHPSRSFVIHTPHANAQKEYIGNAACHAQMATVFAKLMVDGKDYGVGALLVPLRDKKGKTLPGITIC